MKLLVITILLCGIMGLSAISIYDIQYTTNPGRDNTFPSLFVGKHVAVEGIVTAIGAREEGFFMSEPSGGAWRGIFVSTGKYSVNTGDKVIVRGIVDEQFGMTCIKDLKSLSVIDSRHSIPFPNLVTTGQITTAEQAESYEGTLVKIQNSTCVQNLLNGGKYSVNDGSGICLVDDSLINGKSVLRRTGESFSSLIGIVTYAFGVYSVNPRSKIDVTYAAPVFNQNRSWGRIKSIYK